MANEHLIRSLGPLSLRTPLIAASGTVGSVWEWAEIADVNAFGGAVAKSVAPQPWEGRPSPRLAPTATGMLNGVGIQNPGIEEWSEEMTPRIVRSRVPIWGSAVAGDPEEFARVVKGLTASGVTAIEVNLSCPNLEDGHMFSFDARASGEVVTAAVSATEIPLGAKLSPNTPDLVGVAEACAAAGAAFVTLTNTAFGFGIDVTSRRPLLSRGVGGYSGPGLKPLSLRCVYEVARAIPTLPIVGCGGISSGLDVIEYLLAGASAVELGTVLLAEPDAGVRILGELTDHLARTGVPSLEELIGAVREW